MSAEYVLQMETSRNATARIRFWRTYRLSVRPGEIHALLGENGAGKSTLMNVLFGMPVIHATGGFEGSVSIDGEKHDIHLARTTRWSKGIGMVHQEFMLLPGFTVTENIKLNREITTPNLVSRVLRQEPGKPGYAGHGAGRAQGARQAWACPLTSIRLVKRSARRLHAVRRDRA